MHDDDRKMVEEKLRHNMDYSNEIARLYEDRRKHFLELHLTKGKKIFDYNIAFEMATKILFGEEITISE